MSCAQFYVQLLLLLAAIYAAPFAAGDDIVERHAAGAYLLNVLLPHR